MDEIEILSVDLLEAPEAEEFRQLSRDLTLQLGWHYLLDLTWIAQRIEGHTILDAGAGIGLMQWWLAQRGCDVISADRGQRVLPAGLRPVLITGDYQVTPMSFRRRVKQAVTSRSRRTGVGHVNMIHADLGNLPIESESVDCIVSVSALEHNDPDDLPDVVAELMRVLRPGGKLIATLAAGKSDWFLEAASGWAYSGDTLRRVFAIDAPDNYAEYDVLFDKLRASDELRENLAPFYFESGNNGMPWGKWNPEYQAVGVVKTKG